MYSEQSNNNLRKSVANIAPDRKKCNKLTCSQRLGKNELIKPIGELTLMEWDEMFDVNLRGVFVATRAALSHLRSANESFVVNIASLAGKNTFVGGGGYASTKWALRAFSQCLLLEERKQGVRVLSVCPGSVDTSFSPHTGKKDMIRPEDVAVGPDGVADAATHDGE